MNKINLASFVSTPEHAHPSLEPSVWVVTKMVTTEGDVSPHIFAVCPATGSSGLDT